MIEEGENIKSISKRGYSDSQLNNVKRWIGRKEVIAVLDQHISDKPGAAIISVFGDFGVGKSYLKRIIRERNSGRGVFEVKLENVGKSSLVWVGRLLHEVFDVILNEPELLKNKDWIEDFNQLFESRINLVVELIPSIRPFLDFRKTDAVLVTPGTRRNQIHNLLLDLYTFFLGQFISKPFIAIDNFSNFTAEEVRWFNDLLKRQPVSGFVLIERQANSINELLNKNDLDVISIQVNNWSKEELNEWILERLDKIEKDQISSLLDKVYGETEGNPFLSDNYIKTLITKGFLEYDFTKNIWHYSKALPEFNSQFNSEGDILFENFEHLDEACKQVLMMISCFGSNLNLTLMARLTVFSKEILDQCLVKGVNLGILERVESFSYEKGNTKNYKFKSKQFQEELRQKLDPKLRSKLHLKIANYYINSSALGVDDRDLNITLFHLNNSLGLISTEEDKIRYVELSLRGAKRAKKLANFSIASEYIIDASRFRDVLDWEKYYDLCKEVHLEGYQLMRIIDDLQRSEEYYRSANLKFRREDLHQLRMAKIVLDIHFGMLQNALDTGLEALKELGVKISPNASILKIAKEFIKTRIALKGRSMDDLCDLPKINNPKMEKAFEIFFWMFRTTQYLNPELNGVLALKKLQLMLKYGANGEAYIGFMAYGVIIGSGMNDYKSAYEYSEVGRQLAEIHNNKSGKVDFGQAIFSAYKNPLRDTLIYYDNAKYKLIENGDFFGASEATVNESLTYLSAGFPLEVVQNKVRENLEFCKYYSAVDFVSFQEMLALNLKVMQKEVADNADLDRLSKICESTQFKMTSSINCILRMMRDCHSGDWSKALEASKTASKGTRNLTGLYFATEFEFYYCLALLGSVEIGKLNYKTKKKVDKIISRIAKRSNYSPDNHLNKKLLLEGLRAYKNKDLKSAEHLISESVDKSRENNMLHIEAVGLNSLASVFKMMKNNEKYLLAKENSENCNRKWRDTDNQLIA